MFRLTTRIMVAAGHETDVGGHATPRKEGEDAGEDRRPLREVVASLRERARLELF